MIVSLLINVVLLTAIIGSVHAVGIYDQCAGEGYATLPCNPGLSCFRRSKWFSSCLYTCPRGQGWECEFYLPPIQTVAQAWEQCGGQGWGGALFCPTGYTCYSRTIYYAQCRPVNDCPPGWVCPSVVATPTPPLPSILPAYAKCNNVANAICPVSTACFRYSNTYSECRPTCPVTWACETDVVGPNEQCGGDGYVGLTRCAAGLRCYARSKWYSHCAASCPGVEWAC